jgi:thiol-disulfide isomerase/thioredoxin
MDRIDSVHRWILSMALGLIASAAHAATHVPLEERVVNLEVGSDPLYASLADPIRREPPIDRARPVWYGQTLYRVGPNDRDARSARFAVQYRAGVAERVWFDANHDLDFTNDPPIPLYRYPGAPGARSFVTDLSWETSDGRQARTVSRKLRFVLDPSPLGGAPSFRTQQVMGRMGTVRMDGALHMAVLMDGNADGSYTDAFGDGVFVDLNDDRHLEVDMMSPEFGPFSVPFDMAGRRWRCRPVDPRGSAVELEDLGPATSGAFAEAGKLAPGFSFPGPDGTEQRLEDLRGRWVIVQFWASWCSACKIEAPALADLYRRLHPRSLEIVGVSFDEDPAQMNAFREAEGHTWPTTFSGRRFWEDPVGRLYQARGAGIMVLIRPDGIVDGTFTHVPAIEARIREAEGTGSLLGEGAKQP